ncbi:hypothetical protein [Bdellovibrio sp. NC01]|uniref:hypothetical protein n=1 Tax=Bdellovibrio sp. NC01 TaxID=2220073 RepID=UPI001FEFDFE9|nr:hypothetical protein [Bdellovibrio sp. NC01]
MILSAIVLISSSAFAANNKPAKQPCADFARGAAEAVYLADATGIQGHEWDSQVTAYEIQKDKSVVVTVAIAGNNDEGDQWESKVEVTVGTAPSCHIIEMGEIKSN